MDTAEREAVEEAGVTFTKPQFDRVSMNRASYVNPINVGFGTFTRYAPEDKIPFKDPVESKTIKGRMAVRIDQFATQDAMVSQAVYFAIRKLGLISPSPTKPAQV